VKDKKSFARRIGDFLAGKGFYVVLFVCTAVIGVSAWILLSAGNLKDTLQAEDAAGVSQQADEAMAAPDSGIADAIASNDAEARAEVPEETAQPSPSPSASPSAQPSATPKDDGGKKDTAANSEESEEAMSKQLVFVWPIMGDIAVMYSVDELIYNETMADWRTHDGIDIAGMLGAKVMAAADGTVVDIYEDDLLGTTVVIDHGKGLQSIYANLAKVPVVEVGDKVAMGAVIGAVGYTALGESGEVSHLHFAMTQDGSPVDPSGYLPQK
jgi:murein DD-endopeptidase MepM/ murein hydrolase activator NlpD